MKERLRAHLAATGILPPPGSDEARVLVGWSGGADSTCLLLLLRDLGYDPIAAHLDHGQRPESAGESARFAALCDGWGIPFLGGRADVPGIAAAKGIGIEEAGREARYAFFAQALGATGSDVAATGHTRSDLAETVLFHLARGTGMAGLAGIPARRDDVVRPLLIFSREETRAYCEGIGYAPFEDPANTDLAGSRARIRHEALPALERAHPGAEAAIARTAELLSEEDRFLDGAAAAALERAETSPNGALAFLTRDVEVVLDRRAIEVLPRVLFRRALRLAVRAVGGSLDAAQLARLAEEFGEARSGSVTCEGGRVRVVYDRDLVTITDDGASVPARYPLEAGETASDEFGWAFALDPALPTDEPPVRAALAVELDRARVKGGLYFRPPAPGDRMAPLGFAHERRLADLLSEAGLTASARRRLPVVCDLVGPVWVPGVALAGRVAKGEGTRAVLRAVFGPLGSAPTADASAG